MKCKIGFYTRKIEKHTKQQKYTFANTLRWKCYIPSKIYWSCHLIQVACSLVTLNLMCPHCKMQYMVEIDPQTKNLKINRTC